MSESNAPPLSETERKYLRTGEIEGNSYSEKRMRERIENKQKNIPSRLNSLIGDLSLMYRSEHFEFSANSVDIFKYMSIYNTISRALNNRLIAWSTEIIGPEIPGVRVDQPTSGEEFGYYIGGLLHMLLELSEEGSWDETLRGLLIFYLFIPDGEPKDRQNKLKKLTDFKFIIENPEEFLAENITSEFCYEIKFGYDKYEDNTKERQFLDKNEIPQSKILCETLRRPVDDEDFPEYPCAEELFEKNLSELQKNSSFNRAIELNKTIESDIEYLGHKWRGPDRLSILKEMHSNTQRNVASSIAKGLNKSSQGNLVETALKKISVKHYQDENWTTFPVVEESKNQWVFTLYGELLVEYLIGKITDEEFARHGLPEEDEHELIGSVLAEISDKN